MERQAFEEDHFVLRIDDDQLIGIKEATARNSRFGFLSVPPLNPRGRPAIHFPGLRSGSALLSFRKAATDDLDDFNPVIDLPEADRL